MFGHLSDWTSIVGLSVCLSVGCLFICLLFFAYQGFKAYVFKFVNVLTQWLCAVCFRFSLLLPFTLRCTRKQNNAGKSIYDRPADDRVIHSVVHKSLIDCHNSHAPFSLQLNKSFMRKIPPGSEVANLFVGEVAELDKIIAAFVRLKVQSY